MLPAISVAAQAVAVIADLFVFVGHLALVVAVVARPLRQVRAVAVVARIGVAVIHGEGVRAVVIRRTPGGGAVAG